MKTNQNNWIVASLMSWLEDPCWSQTVTAFSLSSFPIASKKVSLNDICNFLSFFFCVFLKTHSPAAWTTFILLSCWRKEPLTPTTRSAPPADHSLVSSADQEEMGHKWMCWWLTDRGAFVSMVSLTVILYFHLFTLYLNIALMLREVRVHEEHKTFSSDKRLSLMLEASRWAASLLTLVWV